MAKFNAVCQYRGPLPPNTLLPEPRMKMQKKSDLPTRICVRCGLPFTWRKKWERVWDEVKYCSERCRRTRDGAA
ncbi:hypothetical protein GCM10022212_15520 [Actimicrobium antarcticum]|uniref:DUF2256 domain-containing protein n=1 Tax=Actimicrobium antarcticum TaxID=1051899 RepID=A0ABP7T2W7_9BURK